MISKTKLYKTMKINKELSKLKDQSPAIIGNAVGTGLSLIKSEPSYAILGAIVSPLIQDYLSRQLSSREIYRVNCSYNYIVKGIEERLKNNELFRDDDFFDDKNERSSAKELFEAVLSKCKSEYQEKKICHISKIYENTVFDNGISSELVNQIISKVEYLTYQKILIISFFGRKNEFDIEKLMKEPLSFYDNFKPNLDHDLILQDVFELMNIGIIRNDNIGIFVKEDITPYQFELSIFGQAIFELMDLKSIEKELIKKIYDNLIYKNEYGLNNNGNRN